MYNDIISLVKRPQLIGLVVGIIGSVLYWLSLILITTDTMKFQVSNAQLVGLGFTIVLAMLYWARTLVVIKGTDKKDL
jgi:hypothetical protein